MNMLSPLPASRWNNATAGHLLNRAAFGGTPAEIEATRRKGLTQAVRDLVDAPNEPPPPPSWAHPRNLAAIRSQVREAKADGDANARFREIRMMEGEEIVDLRHWWLEQMLNGPAPLQEKMTLFWHGHFATSAQKVKDIYWMWLQNDTLRRHGLGGFATLVKKISRDPAMMIYLDLPQSRKIRPNENFARELMELFTVGIGNYSEDDVREAARAFTGYRLDLTTEQFRFARYQHDRTSKTFMGRTGPFGGDDVIDILVSKPAASQFIGRKLWRFFVEDDPSNAIVDLVAKTIRAHNFELRPVLHDIFTSAEFYSERAMRSQIKSPAQFIVQTCKQLEAPLPAGVAAQTALRQMGQLLFAPPNVKGWDGGKSWITTSTLLFRYNFANYLVNGDGILPRATVARLRKGGPGFQRAVQRQGRKVERDPIDVAKIIPADLRDRPNDLVDLLSLRLFQTPAPEKERAAFVQYLETRKPDTSDETMRGLLHLMMSTPQFQLA